MFRNDEATAVATIPAVPAATGATPGYFTKGNPATGVPPTVVPDWWLNQIQDELLNVLAAASIPPVKGINTQLIQSLTAMFGSTSNLSARGTPGFAVLAGGLIIQTFPTPPVTLTAANTPQGYNFTFPRAFPNFCSAIFGSDGGSAGTSWGAFSATSKLGGTGLVWSLAGSGTVQGHLMAVGG